MKKKLYLCGANSPEKASSAARVMTATKHDNLF